MNDSQYPWIILVPRREGLVELYQLNDEDLKQCQSESIAVSKLLMTLFKGDKLNTGALGNMVPQLHLHHVVRYQSDAAWPRPVWGTVASIPYNSENLSNITSMLCAEFSATFADFSLA